MAGGFSGVTNADQMIQKSKEIVNSYTKVMHALHSDMETAAQTIADVERMGFGGPAQSGAFIQKVAGIASTLGNTTTGEMLDFARSSAEMVRGTGISQATAAEDAIQAMAGMRRLASGGYINQDVM